MHGLFEWARSITWVRMPIALGMVALWWWTVWVYSSFMVPWVVMSAWLGGVVLVSALVTALLARRHVWLLGGMVLASPCVGIPAWIAAEAAVDYSRGEATYMRSGLVASFPAYNLHQQLRVPLRNTGCLVDDLLRLRIAVNNATVEVLVSWLGPMPGAYTGPLPTEEEVEQTIAERGQPVAGASEVARWPLRVEAYLLELRDESHGVRVTRLDDPRLLAVQYYWSEDSSGTIRVIDLRTQKFLGGGPV